MEIDDLADRVNAGVGAAAGVDADWLPRQLWQGGFQRFLHGAKAGLRLPAVEVGAVVAQDEFEVAHENIDRMRTCSGMRGID